MRLALWSDCLVPSFFILFVFIHSLTACHASLAAWLPLVLFASLLSCRMLMALFCHVLARLGGTSLPACQIGSYLAVGVGVGGVGGHPARL